jgi:hypothetical protein
MATRSTGTGANIGVRAEARPAGLKAQQAQKPTVGAGDSGPPTPRCGHRPAHFGQVGLCRHRAACETSQRRSGSIKSLAPGDVITFHDSLQVPGRADDQRGMDMIVAEEVSYLTDGSRQRMSCGSREHHLGHGTQHPIHRSRIRTEEVPISQGGASGCIPGGASSHLRDGCDGGGSLQAVRWPQTPTQRS